MREFTSSDSFIIKGRGRVYIITGNQFPEEFWNPNQLVGELIKINGQEYKVRGVEAYKIHISPEHPYRLGFGILVDS